jgi:uncharacterized cupredoxin-like copper-binding protein
VEAELAFFAQDKLGNIWRMGEYPEEYDAGKFVKAPTWLHGVQDARAGVAMWAEPEVGTPWYSQGWGPAVNWTDRGKVDEMGKKVCVPVACYDDTLIIAETSASEPDAQQLKTWARGVGNVHVGWRGGGEKTKETLELAELKQLSPDELAEVRTEALKLEKHAYEVSKDVYGTTAPAEQTLTAQVPAPAEGVVTEVKVTLTDFKIALDKASVPVGKVRFIIENTGKEEHDFMIEEVGGMDEPLAAKNAAATVGDIFAGKIVNLEWTFDKAGTYQLACHNTSGADDHFKSGMNVELTVTK